LPEPVPVVTAKLSRAEALATACFQELIEKWATRYDLSPTDSELEKELLGMDSQIYRSWMNVQTARNGAGRWGHLAYEFINHVNGLSKSMTHLYSVYREYH